MAAKLIIPNTLHKVTQSGFMMVEVMVAILLFSIGLMGLVALQTTSAQNATNAEYRTIAANLSNELVTQMWIKNTADPAAADLSPEVTSWKAKVAASLPNATGEVLRAGGVTSVTVRYKLPSKLASENSNQYSTQVVIP